MQEINVKKQNKNLKKELYIKIIILIVLLLLFVITSFNTGRKFYLLKNTYFETTNGEISSGISRWNFEAKVIMREVNAYEE